MEFNKLIDRINVLAKISKEQGLTEEEKIEQASLRQEYIKLYRSNLEQTLEQTYIVDEMGNKKKLERKGR